MLGGGLGVDISFSVGGSTTEAFTNDGMLLGGSGWGMCGIDGDHGGMSWEQLKSTFSTVQPIKATGVSGKVE